MHPGWRRRRSKCTGRFRKGRYQRGRGPRWDRFTSGVKNVANRAWNKISPNLISAGKAAIPRAAKVLLNPFANKSDGLKGVAMNFGKDLANSFVPGITNQGRSKQRRVVGSRIRAH
jgi:hypothetical protein